MTADNFISGIYNYCDRWCERCIFTRSCAVFDQTEKMIDGEGGNDLETFFEKLKDILEKTHKILDEKLKEIYPEGIPNEISEEYELKNAEIEKKIDGHALYQSAKEYSSLVRRWFEENEKILSLRHDDYNSKSSELGEAVRPKKNELLSEVVEIILFYQYFIEVKIKRALFDKYEYEEDNEDYLENILTTQKLILLAVTRSLASWEILYDQMKHQNNSLAIMLHLDKIKRGAESIFPQAQSFKRPYFD